MMDESLLQDFIAESNEHLEEIEKNLLKLSSGMEEFDIINDIFRSIHTIKGSSEYLGMVGIAELSHKMENLLDKIRQKTSYIDDKLIDTLISGTDRIALLVEELSQKGEEKSEISDILKKIEEIESSNSSSDGLTIYIPDKTSLDKQMSEQDEGIIIPSPSVIYEEDYDIELLNIFIEQLFKGLVFLKNKSQEFIAGIFRPEHLDECVKNIISLQRSANYMGYDELVDLFKQWRTEIEHKANMDPDFVMNNIASIVAMFPKIDAINELVCKGIKYPTMTPDHGLISQKNSPNSEPLDIKLKNTDSLELEESADSVFQDEKQKKQSTEIDNQFFENMPVNDSLLKDFITETGEQLDEIEGNLLQLSSDLENAELINDIFRSIHTIKGSSEYLGMIRIAELSHKMENILDKIRQKAIVVDDNLIDTLILGTDRIALLVQELSQEGEEQSEISDLLQKIKKLEHYSPDVSRQDYCVSAETVAQVLQQDESILIPSSKVTYQEDYDTELFDIFTEQLHEGLKFLKDKVQIIISDKFEPGLIEECIKKIKTLQGSANYMGYEKLSDFYEQWCTEIDQKSNINPDLMISNIASIVAMFPKIDILNNLVCKDIEYPVKMQDRDSTSQQETHGPQSIDIESPIEESLEEIFENEELSVVDSDESFEDIPVDNSLLQDFVAESGELLNEIESDLLQLSSGIYDSNILNNIFRSIHTIKGSSEYLGMEQIAQLSHRMENLLEKIRSKEIVVHEVSIDILIAGRDRIKELTEEVDKYGVERCKIDDIIFKIDELFESKAQEDNREVTKNDILDSSFRPEIDESENIYKTNDDLFYEADSDTELFEIFIKQTHEGLEYLKERIEKLTEDSFKESLKKIESLKTSAHYMSYDRLVDMYAEWVEELKTDFIDEDTHKVQILIIDKFIDKITKIIKMFPKINVFEDLLSIKALIQAKDNDVESKEEMDDPLELKDKVEINKTELIEADEDVVNLNNQVQTIDVERDETKDAEKMNNAEGTIEETSLKDTGFDEKVSSDILDLEYITSQKEPNINEKEESDVLELENIVSPGETDTDSSDGLIELSEIISEEYSEDDIEYSKRIDEFVVKIENDIESKFNLEDESDEDYYSGKHVKLDSTNEDELLECNDLEKTIYEDKLVQEDEDQTMITKEDEVDMLDCSTSSEVSVIKDKKRQHFLEIDDDYFNSSFPEEILTSLHAEFDLSNADKIIAYNKTDISHEGKKLSEVKRNLTSLDTEKRKPEKTVERPLTHSVRVDAIKIDALINQVGELVVNRAFFAQLYNEMRTFEHYIKQHNKMEKKDFKQIKALTYRLNEATMALGRMTNDLQEKVMQVRMMPISQLFNRYPRLVHDLVRGVKKRVKLDIIGEDTELDRIVLERIADPLVHIIRNSIDHGIETVTERERKGKSAIGLLRLEAYHEGNHVVIKVIDDGRGIDVERIKAKVLEKQLLTRDEIGRMSEKELTSLIMQPGFSTASQITHTSGRGVGMDVVKKNVEKLNGTLEIESDSGIQTQIRIKIPLTLAIIPALLVRVGHDLFTIPLSTVDETIRLYENNHSKIENVEVFYLRDETIPLLRLTDVFKIYSKRKVENDFVVVVKAGNTRVGLIVDELVGREEVVIKPLEDYLQEGTGFSGATILGDGSISLILDVFGLINLYF
jgi:chemotaxis protein histidine kinase CheA